MFNSLTGRISGHDFPHVYLTDGAVEWELEVSATTFQAVLAASGEEHHRVLVHLHVREDLLQLYGFWTAAERRAFRELLKVPGIGPRQALRILSGTTVPVLTELLEREDVESLTRIPGLGKKTAQKMILQLKGHLATDGAEPGGGPTGTADGDDGELVAALVDMGFDRSAARTALRTAREEIGSEDGPADEQELFRRAIVALSSA